MSLSPSGHSERQELPLTAAAHLEDGARWNKVAAEVKNTVELRWMLSSDSEEKRGEALLTNVSHEAELGGEQKKTSRQSQTHFYPHTTAQKTVSKIRRSNSSVSHFYVNLMLLMFGLSTGVCACVVVYKHSPLTRALPAWVCLPACVLSHINSRHWKVTGSGGL